MGLRFWNDISAQKTTICFTLIDLMQLQHCLAGPTHPAQLVFALGAGIHKGLGDDRQRGIHHFGYVDVEDEVGVLQDVNPEPQRQAANRGTRLYNDHTSLSTLLITNRNVTPVTLMMGNVLLHHLWDHFASINMPFRFFSTLIYRHAAIVNSPTIWRTVSQGTCTECNIYIKCIINHPSMKLVHWSH